MELSANDPLSYANSEHYLTKNLKLDWDIDFEHRIIDGSVTFTFKNLTKKKEPLRLDTKYLNIRQVSLNGVVVPFTLERRSTEVMGLCLTVPVDTAADEFEVSVTYGTTRDCKALQWLRPEQTRGKRQPYLFSQCEAIHARSLLPCQDSPGVKAPFSAKVRAPASLNVLMSAIKEAQVVTEGDCKVHNFHQKVPVPSYLVAVVCGHLEGRKIGPRSTVWSEPEMVEEAAREFSDTETFLATGEELCGPYVWGVYDILVLPPSFPYGGMENPCLTFVTPTLLVGDKSLVNVIAHEISHSWTGNLVTNATWEDFWLNEGHTTYLEYMLMGRHLRSERMRHLIIQAGLAELAAALSHHGHDHHHNTMVQSLRECDPDDSFSVVPYEKGQNLLFHLEQIVGGQDVMLRWLRAYVEKFKYASLTTPRWKEYFYEYMTGHEKVDKSLLDGVDWEGWFFGRGEIPVMPTLNEECRRQSETLADRWISAEGVSPSDRDNLLTGYNALMSLQQYYMLQVIHDVRKVALSHDKLRLMGQLYGFTDSTNSEILFSWALMVIASRYDPAVDQVFAFLNSVGRLKYNRPIYKALFNWPEMRARTIDNFQMMRSTMHPTTENSVRNILELP